MSSIKVSKRDFSIKPKRLRREGMIPGSVFGGPLDEAVSLQIEAPVVRKMLETHRIGSRLELELDGETIPVQLKEKSSNPMNMKDVWEVSFQALKADQKVNSVISIVLQNTDKITTAVLEEMLLEIPYSALPKDMIDTITIDVDGLPVGTVITVGDVKELQNENLDIHVPSDEIIFRIVEKKIVVEETEGDEEAAAADEEAPAAAEE